MTRELNAEPKNQIQKISLKPQAKLSLTKIGMPKERIVTGVTIQKKHVLT